MEELNTVNAVADEVVTVQEAEPEETDTGVQSEPADTQSDAKPVQSAEENAKFAELRRKFEAESEAKAQAKADALVAEIYGDQGIYTEADLKAAREAQQAEERGLTPEEYEALQIGMTQKQKAQRKQEDIDAIVKLAVEQGFNVKDIPGEVFEQWKDGEGGRLVDIYNQHNSTTKEKTYLQQLAERDKKIAEYEKALGIQKINEENAQAAAGGVGGNGQNETVGFISQDLFEKNRADQKWVIKNLSKITESRKKW